MFTCMLFLSLSKVFLTYLSLKSITCLKVEFGLSGNGSIVMNGGVWCGDCWRIEFGLSGSTGNVKE